MDMRIWLLGRFATSVGSRRIPDQHWRSRKAANLVKLLALAPGHRMHREQVESLLWPQFGAATNNLHHTMYVARKLLGLDPATSSRYLGLRSDEVTLCPQARLWTDVKAFTEAALAANEDREPYAYRAALELYAGDLLPENRYDEWVETRRAELIEMYLSLLVKLSRLHEEREEEEAAIETLKQVVRKEPTREEAHTSLIRLYASCGRRGEALSQYRLLGEILLREFSSGPSPESRSLYEEILAGRFQQPRHISSTRQEEHSDHRHNLPLARTSFVGRRREAIEVKRLLAMTSLLTLTGTGGSGKTRLALRVGHDLHSIYRDGVWLVELAQASDPEQATQALSTALGVREQPGQSLMDTLVHHLRRKKLLLILDNCEHIVEGVATLADTLLRRCRELRILATSREPLDVPGELNWRIPSLSVPEPEHTPKVEDLMRSEAARLFVDRARSRLPTFELTQANAGTVAEVCRKLDGIPLAIELASARLPVLAVEQVVERLNDSLELLTSATRTVAPRQKTMRAALDWSYALLSEPERVLFRRLSWFAGGWTLEAAEAVAADGELPKDGVLDLLSRLVDKSLVIVETSDERRYRMLEVVRQYANELSNADDEHEAIRSRHANWYAGFAGRVDEAVRGPEGAAWVGRLARELPNVRSALSWSLDAEPETALRIAGTLGHSWYRHGYVIEGHQWLEAALARTTGPGTPMRARALHIAGVLADERGLYDRAEVLLDEGLSLWRSLGDSGNVATLLNSLGVVVYSTGDVDRSIALTEEALEIKRALDDKRGIETSLSNLAEMLQSRGDLSRAQTLLEENLAASSERGDDWGVSLARLNLGILAVDKEEPERAETLLAATLRTFWRHQDVHYTVDCLDAIGQAYAAQGHGMRAAKVLGAAGAARKQLDVPVRLAERDRYERLMALSRRDLDEITWNAAWTEGRKMSIDEAVEYALTAEPVAPEDQGIPWDRTEALTPRESEIAHLIARGLTNRSIASELSISERTVTTHVGRILKKLNLHSRTGVAARMLDQGRSSKQT
jgi:predicted ATPase/DNA-binding SARP family transcriptional activator/DNA-binding CsgD family transcriptional regulator